MTFRKVHGRRLGRPLNQERQEALDSLYPVLSIEDSRLDNSGSLPASSLFKNSPDKIYFEIGFGSGDFLKKLIQDKPDDAHELARYTNFGQYEDRRTGNLVITLPEQYRSMGWDDMKKPEDFSADCVKYTVEIET